MSNFLLIFLYILFGLISGVFGGLGMGGGTLLIPLLTIFLKLNQKLSQGINLIAFIVMAIFALIIHAKNGFLKLKSIFWVIFGGVVFSALGAFLATLVSNEKLKIAFGIFLCLLSVYQIAKIVILSVKKKVSK
jgi:hypothetical protein